MGRGWIWVQIPKAVGSALSIIQSHYPTCCLTLIASKAPNSNLLLLVWASLHLRLCVDMMAGWGAWKACDDHGSVENQPWWEAIITVSLSSFHLHPLHPTSPIPSSLRVASRLLSIIPTSLVRKLGWHLEALSPLLPFTPYTSPLSISHPLLPVHWLVYGGWHWANSISCPHQPSRVLQPPVHRHTPPVGCQPVFYTSHLPRPPSLHRTFYFLICHSCFPFTCFF